MEDTDPQPSGAREPAASSASAPLDSETSSVHYVVPEEDRVPVVEKTAYAMGVVSDHYAQFAIHGLLWPFFNVFLGLSPVLIGTAMGLSRLWDAINDPLVGTLSDRCKSRFGRRRPFLFWGAILTGLMFPLIWLMPQGWVDLEPIFEITVPGFLGLWETYPLPITWPLIWLSAAFIAYYTCYSVLSVPYEALGMELTPDYQERTNVYTFRTYVMKVFDLGNYALLPVTFMVAGWFVASEMGHVAYHELVYHTDDTEQLEQLKVEKLGIVVPLMAIGVGGIIIVSGILPAIFCRERYHKVAQEKSPENVLKGMVSLGGNLPFWVVAGSISLYLLGVMGNGVLSFYVGSYYIYDAELEKGAWLGFYNSVLGMIFGIIGAFVIDLLARRFDKRPLLLYCVALMLICNLATSLTYQPGHPWLTLVTRPFYTIGETGFWVLIISMRADVGDWDELKTGRRREGIIAASINWLVKLSIALASVIGGILLQYAVGWNSEDHAGQTPETLNRLKWTFVIVQSCTTLVVLILLAVYPLTRAKLAGVRETLEERRGKV